MSIIVSDVLNDVIEVNNLTNSAIESGFSNSKLNVFLAILDAGETIFGSFSSSWKYLPLESYLQKCL